MGGLTSGISSSSYRKDFRNKCLYIWLNSELKMFATFQPVRVSVPQIYISTEQTRGFGQYSFQITHNELFTRPFIWMSSLGSHV